MVDVMINQDGILDFPKYPLILSFVKCDSGDTNLFKASVAKPKSLHYKKRNYQTNGLF